LIFNTFFSLIACVDDVDWWYPTKLMGFLVYFGLSLNNNKRLLRRRALRLPVTGRALE